MRQMISGLVAAVAVVGLSAAPAKACGFSSGCGSPCSAPVYNPCGGPGVYSYGLSYGTYERLPSINVPQYYYVNQGPTYTGPGAFAPYPTYQERAVSGWQGVSSPYYYGYYGGPYANATSHYYDGAPRWSGPAIYRNPYVRGAAYRPYRASPRYYGVRRAAYSPTYGYRSYGVRSGYAPRYGYARPSVRYGVPAMHGRSAYRGGYSYAMPRQGYRGPAYHGGYAGRPMHSGTGGLERRPR